MKTILCFGDSNTYGYRPDNKKRYSKSERWTGILSERFNEGESEAEIIEEGLVGRTTVFEDNLRPGRKGIDYLYPILESHAPIDQLVLMLGTNDCKASYKATPQVIGYGIERLIKEAKRFDDDMKILLVSPINLGDEVWREEFDPEFDTASVEVSKKLKSVYSKLAGTYNIEFLAASDVAEPSLTDQEHLDESGHQNLANAIYEIIK